MSTAVFEPQTVTPTHEAEALASVAALLHASQMPALVGPQGEQIKLPFEVYKVLQDVIAAMQEGKGVTVVPRDTLMTTQTAADFLGVSRPTLVKLLESDEIPFTQPSRHRRVMLSDLLAYKERRRNERRAHLDEVTKLSTEVNLPQSFIATR